MNFANRMMPAFSINRVRFLMGPLTIFQWALTTVTLSCGSEPYTSTSKTREFIGRIKINVLHKATKMKKPNIQLGCDHIHVARRHFRLFPAQHCVNADRRAIHRVLNERKTRRAGQRHWQPVPENSARLSLMKPFSMRERTACAMPKSSDAFFCVNPSQLPRKAQQISKCGHSYSPLAVSASVLIFGVTSGPSSSGGLLGKITTPLPPLSPASSIS